MNQTAEFKISQSTVDTVKKAKMKLRAFDHKLRRQLLNYLIEKEESIVTKMYKHFRIEQSVCSQHLAILRRANLVKCRRDGKEIYYSANITELDQMQQLCEQLNTPAV